MNRRISTALLFALAILGMMAAGYVLQSRDGSLRGMMIVSVALLAFFGLYLFFERSLGQVDVQKRFERILQSGSPTGKDGDDARQAMARRQVEELYDTRQTWVERTAQILRRIFRVEGRKLDRLRAELNSAGLYRDRDMSVYMVSMAAAPVVGMIAGYFWASLKGSDQTMFMVWMAAGAGAGFYGLRVYISRLTRLRQQSVAQSMPEAIDLLVIYAQSGMGSDSAIKEIVTAIRARYPIMSGELTILVQELQLLSDRSRAYDNFQSRCNIPIVKSFSSIMQQSERTGSSISESLGTLAVEMRRERLFEAKRKAAKLPTLMQIPIVLFILPALFMTVLGPVVLTVLKIFHKIP